MNRSDFTGTNLEYFEGRKYKPCAGHKGGLVYIESKSGIEGT